MSNDDHGEPEGWWKGYECSPPSEEQITRRRVELQKENLDLLWKGLAEYHKDVEATLDWHRRMILHIGSATACLTSVAVTYLLISAAKSYFGEGWFIDLVAAALFIGLWAYLSPNAEQGPKKEPFWWPSDISR